MYSDLVERNVSSGERLVTMVTANSYTVLAVSCEFVSYFRKEKEGEYHKLFGRERERRENVIILLAY